MGIRVRTRTTVAAIMVTALSCLAVVADEPSPTPVLSVAGSASPHPARTPIVIDNETLRKYANQGRVTSVERPSSSRASGAGVTALGGGMGKDSSNEDAAKRRYWRELYQQQLNLVRSLEQQIEILDREIPGLWRDFYSRDDPMYRDGVIKPKLDEALARRDRIEEQLGEERERLPKIREDARRDGAQPGWFRGLDQPPPGEEQADEPPAAALPSNTVDSVGPDET
jgi:hypothetical protein